MEGIKSARNKVVAGLFKVNGTQLTEKQSVSLYVGH
jgi:hypothetical protein